MISVLSIAEARNWFDQLPSDRRLATLSPEYLDADGVRDKAIEPVIVGFREGDLIWLHGVHRRAVPGTDCFDFESPYGYGGPVSNSDDAGFLARAWSAYTAWCRDQRVIAEFVRLHPMAADWQLYGGEKRDNRFTVAVPLKGPDIRANYETRCRTAVRKAEQAGARVNQQSGDDMVGRFPDFYRRGMVGIGAGEFYMFGDSYFAALAKLPGMTCLACERDGEWLAAGLFLREGTTLEYHLSATTAEGRRISATNQLLDAAAALGHQQGLDWLYLGGGSDEKPDNPLLFFKTGFSKVRRLFSTGSAIHRPEIYQSLREAYRHAGGQSSRILFYRAS